MVCCEISEGEIKINEVETLLVLYEKSSWNSRSFYRNLQKLFDHSVNNKLVKAK